MATIISCYFYLPGSLCLAKQFKVLLARFLWHSEERGGGEDMVGQGRKKRGNKYKTITILTTICSKIKRDLYITQIGFDVSARVLSHRDLALPEKHSFLGFEIEKIYLQGGWE